jgi:hypothetical protein
MSSNRAAAILAFSYDSERPLPGVTKELQSLKEIIGLKGAMQVQDLWKPKHADVELALGNYSSSKFGDAVHIFHFSGHASPQAQQWNDDADGTVEVDAQRLADYMGCHCKEIKLVFLNGCSSEGQAKYFIDQGARAVIATTRAVGDALAARFAVEFYVHFTNLNAARSLRLSFEAAWKSVGLQQDETVKRDIDMHFLNGYEEGSNPYELHIHPQHPDTENATFEAWQAVATRPGQTVPLVDDRAKIKTKGIADSAYLLCNREKQQALLSAILDQKLQGADDLPHFVALHDERRHCPQFMADWMREYGAKYAVERQKNNLLKPEMLVFKSLKVLTPEGFDDSDWSDPANEARDKFQLELLAQYETAFGMDAQGLLAHIPKERAPLLVLTQLVDFEGWGDSSRDLANFGLLLAYYRGEFSQKQLARLSPRTVVVLIFLYSNSGKDQRFEDMLLQQAAAQADSRFTSVTDFRHIRSIHLDELQQRLEAQFFDAQDLIDKEDPLTMNTTHKELGQYISQHNQRIGSGA